MTDSPKRRWLQFHLSTAIVAMVLAGIFIGVGRWYWKRHIQGITPELERIEFADPVIDAQTAISNRDFHFVGVFGIGLSVPGVTYDLQKRYGAKGIPGTSDCIVSSEQLRLQALAVDYAKAYNRSVLDALPKEKKD
jgi:hypothetical protein